MQGRGMDIVNKEKSLQMDLNSTIDCSSPDLNRKTNRE